jgi:hypothetical protein
MYLVLPFYKMPEITRLVEFLDWNRDIDKVIAVTDRPLGLEDGRLEELVYPQPLPIFSLSKTCNYGIRYVGEKYGWGSTIVKTDVDIVFPLETLKEMARVEEGQAYSPPYHMVNSFKDRFTYTPNRLVADLAIGTIAMVGTDWMKTCGYNEKLEGYGCDDGDMWHRIGLKGIKRWRGIGCYHIAHRPSSPQKEKHCLKTGDNRRLIRTDHHGRNTGVNPNRMRENSKIVQSGVWENQEWGKA